VRVIAELHAESAPVALKDADPIAGHENLSLRGAEVRLAIHARQPLGCGHNVADEPVSLCIHLG